jgi:Protein of unknown function (DUF1264)
MRSLGTALLSLGVAAIAGFACAEGNPSTSNLDPSAVQSSAYFEPIRQIGVYLDGFHVMKQEPNLFLEAHHYCAAKSDDLLQCAIFDGNTSDANLVGIEYIISERLFGQLPADEKKLWHPHDYEILAGQLIAPGMHESEEKALMKKWINSYGKTWHLWNTGYFGQPHADSVPLGVPILAWSFNADGEAPAQMVSDRDQRFGISTEQRRKDRADLRSLAQPQEGVNDLAPFFPNRHVPDFIKAK